jgi:hypothetical protein
MENDRDKNQYTVKLLEFNCHSYWTRKWINGINQQYNASKIMDNRKMARKNDNKDNKTAGNYQ